jgi:hypothetical protein
MTVPKFSEEPFIETLPDTDSGEGNRTPDLLNAIQALSQISYARAAVLSAS